MSSVKKRLQAAINNEQQKTVGQTQRTAGQPLVQRVLRPQQAQQREITLPTSQLAMTLGRNPSAAMESILQASVQHNALKYQQADIIELGNRVEEARRTADEMSRMESSGMTYEDFQALEIPGSERFKQYRNAAEARRVYQSLKSEYESAQRDRYDRNQAQNASNLEGVRGNSDFRSVVDSALSETWRPGNIFTGNADARNVARDIQLLARQAEGRETDEVGDTAKNMTQEQRDTLMYYAGTNQWDMASEYLESIQREVNAKAAQAEMETAREYSQQHPILGAVGNAAAGLLTPISYLANAGNVIRNQITGEYTPTDVNSNLFQGARLNQATQEGVTTAAQDMPILGNIEIGGRNLGSELAGVGLSIGQVLSRLPFGPAGALALAGGSAAGQQTYDTLASGGTEGQALAMSTAAGLIEAATEKIGIDRLFEVFGRTGRQGLRQVIRDVAIQAGIEGTEEAISEVTNTIADNFIMGENSQYNQTVNQLMSQGVSREDAQREAVNQVLQNVGWSAFGGALSGGVMGGGASAINTIRNRVTLPTAGQNGVLPTANQTTVDTTQPTVEATRPTVETTQPTVERDNVMSTTREQIRSDLSTRRDFQQYTDQAMQNNSQEALGDMFRSGEVGVDAENNIFLRDPEDHIDQRSMGYVGNRKVNAFQFDNPALHSYFSEAAEYLLEDLGNTIPGERWSYEATSPDGTHYTQWNGTKRATTDQIAELLDDQHMTYNQIMDAAKRIINDQGQENRATAKRVELILDDMLTNGWRDVTGYYHEPNHNYVRMKQEIPGAYIPEETADYDRLADIDPLPEGVTLESEVSPVVQRLSQALGRNIQMYDGSRESGTRGTANGYYADGTIYVNSQSTNPVAQVIAHELTHSVEMADAYQELQSLIFDRIQQTGGNLEQMRAQKADLYQRNGVNLNAQDLDAEIVAEYVEKNLLTDEASIQELTRTNRTLAQRIRDWIDSILAKLGNADAQSRVFLERARGAYSRALQQTQGTVDTVATVDTVGSVASQRQVQSLLDQYDSGAITQEQLIERATRLLERETRYSISEQTDQEKQSHAKAVLDHRNYFSDGTTPQVSEVSRFRYSLDENQRNQFISMLRNYARGNWNEQTIQEYLNLVRQNGEYDQGANAARPVLVPQRDSEGNPVSRTARTAMGAKAIPESVASDIANLVRTGQMSYERVGDKASTQRAIQRIQNDGFKRSMQYFSDEVRKGIASKDLVTLGQQLLINAANAGDGEATAELLNLYAQMGTSVGQATQAYSILRKLDPSDQLYAIQKTVSNLEEEIQKRFKDKNITIDPALLEEFQNQTDDAGRDAVKKKIYQNVADQIPSNWRDRWNAWRYMAMLVNPRTHIRNVAGNAFFQPVRMVKDKVAATMEIFVRAINPNFEKTKSFVANPDLYRAALSDYKNVKDILSGNKYDDIRSEINSRRTVFGGVLGKPFEAVRTVNSLALEAEDATFKHLTYADALSGYLQSRGVTGEQLRSGNVDSNVLSAARDYAGQEALKATYQDKNQFSDLLSRRFQENNTAGKVANAAIDAVLPFRRTPANILVRGFEYSPLGLAKSLTADLVQVKRGNMSGAQAIDNIAAGLTGSGLFALGAMLLAHGIVTSGGDENEEQNDLNDLTGKQNYALNLPGGGSVTLDWLAPESLPFFMGVEFMDALGEGGSVMETITSALTSISEPMLELSMLQSLNDLIDSVSFAESSGKLVSMAGSALISYLTQAIPTLGGQIERTTEENRMSSFTDRNNPLPRDIQYAISRASARLPGDYQQVPYIDAWGRTESNGNPLTRALNNFLNPAYTSQINETAADREIQRLLDAGMTGVVPDRTTQSQKVDGAYLSPEQYVEYATIKGQTSYDVVSEMIESELYQNMTDEEKADAIKRAYQYAGHVAAQSINPEHESESYVSGAQNAQDDFGLSEAEYLLMDRVYGKSGLERIKETMDSGVSMDTAIEVNNALDSLKTKSGEDSVSNLQRYRAVVDNVSSVNQQLSVLKTVSTDSDYRKFVVGNNFGVSPSSYVTAREAMSRFDQPNSSGNLGTYTQAEIEAMLDSFPSSATLTGSGTMTLTNSQKAVLWQLISGSSSPKNNPYSYSIGQQVIDAVNEAKQSNNQSTTQTNQYSGLLNFLPGG